MHSEEMGVNEGTAIGVRVGNYLRFCSENRNCGLTKGETLGRFLLILSMSVSLTYGCTWLGAGLDLPQNLLERKSRHGPQILS